MPKESEHASVKARVEHTSAPSSRIAIDLYLACQKGRFAIQIGWPFWPCPLGTAAFRELVHQFCLSDLQEKTFAERLRQILEEKSLTQDELAERIGCTQSAVSKMLSRNARPQRKTIFKMAQALNIKATELWPNLEVAAILDSVSDFFADRELTQDQAKALETAGLRQPAKVKTGDLPSRKRK